MFKNKKIALGSLIASGALLLAVGCGVDRSGSESNVCTAAFQHIASCVSGSQAMPPETCDAEDVRISNEVLGLDCAQVNELFGSEVGFMDYVNGAGRSIKNGLKWVGDKLGITGGEKRDTTWDGFEEEMQDAEDRLDFSDPEREKFEGEKTCMYDDGCEEENFEKWKEQKDDNEEDENSSNDDDESLWETNG